MRKSLPTTEHGLKIEASAWVCGDVHLRKHPESLGRMHIRGNLHLVVIGHYRPFQFPPVLDCCQGIYASWWLGA